MPVNFSANVALRGYRKAERAYFLTHIVRTRGGDSNFSLESVGNNELLFGGAAAQFTNTDLSTQFRIHMRVFKPENDRNSGSVVNILTAQGANARHGTAFCFAERHAL